MKKKTGDQRRAVVNNLLTRNGIYVPPVPIEEIARADGMLIARNPFNGTESGFALRDGMAQIIGVNSLHPHRRQRFTIAHEIGHLKLHAEDLIVDHAVSVHHRDENASLGTIPQEIEANAFAAELLMPEAMVREQVRSHVERGIRNRDELTRALASLFDVSAEAMGYRFINLGIFP